MFDVPRADGEASLPPDVQRPQRWQSLTVCLLLALAVWAVFGQTRRFGFINYDDNIYVYDNPAITQGLNGHQLGWIITHGDGPVEWLPVTALSRMLDWQLYGANAGGHHLTNVLLHAANAILLFLVLRSMTGALWRSAWVAALFAIHPLRVESVAWVTERKDVLSGLFFMLTLWAYVKAVTRDKGQVTGTSIAPASCSSRVTCHLSPFYWLAVLFFALGLMSKTMLMTVPFVLLLLDYWPLRRSAECRVRSAECGMRSGESTGKAEGIMKRAKSGSSNSQLSTLNYLLLEKVPFFVLSAAACATTLVTQNELFANVQGLSFAWRAGTAVMAYADYLRHLVYPAGLALIYPPLAGPLPVGRIALSALLLLLITAGVVAGRRRRPYLLVGWLWYLVMLAPVIDVLQHATAARADRYTYLPQIGLGILLAWGAVGLLGRAALPRRRRLLGALAGVTLPVLAALAYIQTGYWSDSITLWTHSLACTSGNSVAHYNLGNALARQGRLGEAITHYEQALQLKPDQAIIHVNLANALTQQGKMAEAIPHYERALQLQPDYAVAHFDLGIVLGREGKLAEARPHFQQALALATAQGDIALANAAHARLQPNPAPQPPTP